MLEEGTKHDEGKVPIELWSSDALIETAKVLQFGEQKYEAWNWAKGIKYRRVFGAMMRHSWSWWKGEQLDPETGLHHLAHVMCCCMFLLHYELNRRTYRKFDDRHRTRKRRA